MAKAYLLCGSTGAGKSTLSRKIAQEHSAQIFSIDEWMKMLFWSDAPQAEVFPWALERVRRCEDLIYILAERLLKKNQNVILDLAYSTKKQREKAYTLFQSLGLQYQLIFVDVPVEVRLQRVRGRNSQKTETFEFEVTDEMFHFMETQFEPPTQEELNARNGILMPNP